MSRNKKKVARRKEESKRVKRWVDGQMGRYMDGWVSKCMP